MSMQMESELVQRAKAGDVPAFETLYRSYNNRIYNFARQITGSAEDAGDIVQESFIKAWNSLPGLRQESTFGIWLHRIALNLSRDFLKKRGRELSINLGTDGEVVELQVEDPSPNPEHTVISSETQAAVRRAVETLSADHRLVVTMHHLEGMDVESIARIMGISKGTVMSRLSRAREALRRKLAPHVGGE